MGQYAKHIFVCTHGSWCSRDGDTDTIIRQFKQSVAAAGLQDAVRVNRAGCFSQCGHGPMVVVYPAGRWYAGVRPEDVEEIVSQDIVADQPAAHLLYHAPPGDNKDLSRYPPELVSAVRSAQRDG